MSRGSEIGMLHRSHEADTFGALSVTVTQLQRVEKTVSVGIVARDITRGKRGRNVEFNEIVGKTLESVELNIEHDDRIIFNFTDGTICESLHVQDCCESVCVNAVDGAIEDIIGSPILVAEETHELNVNPPDEGCNESWTWTKQVIRTEKGEVVFVWLGESNGYYGETPYFEITHKGT